jgi:hypothetical protein
MDIRLQTEVKESFYKTTCTNLQQTNGEYIARVCISPFSHISYLSIESRRHVISPPPPLELIFSHSAVTYRSLTHVVG